ncbi:MAG: hypothetical protein ACOH5I_17815 [Oligoflexus sp.]
MNSNFKVSILNTIMILCLALGCRKETTDNVIAEERRLYDTLISEARPNDPDYAGAIAKIGFDQDDMESRMLLSFPQIIDLYQKEVVLSSIANISIEVKAASLVPVNPENIHLYLLSSPWSPFVTWNSRVSFLEGYEWQQAGGDLSNYGPFFPDISKTTNAELSYKTLRFDITPAIIELISLNELISGAIILIQPSPNNAAQELTLYTSNYHSELAHPRAILAFNQEGIFR